MMKTIGFALTILGTALFAGAPVGAAERHAPYEPFAVYGNTYYVNQDNLIVKVAVERSSAAAASLTYDILASPHPELSGLYERKAKQPALDSVAFIDNDARPSYADRARTWIAQILADDAAATESGEVAK